MLFLYVSCGRPFWHLLQINPDIRFLQVSKLCCSTCWELLSKLSKESFERFHVRGFHAKIFPCEVPPWVPENIVKDMTALLQTKVTEEVKYMMQKDAEGRPLSRRSSISSVQSSGTLGGDSILSHTRALTSGDHTMGRGSRSSWLSLGLSRILGSNIFKAPSSKSTKDLLF